MAKHDENKDLRSIAKVASISYGEKTIRIQRGTHIGIRRWGKLDFLHNYCGWYVFWVDKPVRIVADNIHAPKAKHNKEEKHKLTNKKKR